ncbi:YhbY family RNA-binding protein [Candidatus Pacearchaeota archaeon]|nr:YhbY family RNA-binding protein [Candidatus Pacearchaeota archaeon]
MTSQLEIQLGKRGLTSTFLEDIKKRFENNKVNNIKISVLRSARENREDMKKYAEEIKNYLGDKYTYRILGFSIFLKKWRKNRT